MYLLIKVEEFNKLFPHYIPIIKQIRQRHWEDIAWAWFVNDKSEEIFGKDQCNKENFLKTESQYSIKFKENYLETLPEENKNDYKLLIKLDLEKEKQKSKELAEEIWKEFPENIHPNGNPNKINSVEFLSWSLEDAIKLGRKVRKDFYDIPVFNGYGFNDDEYMRKKLKFASSLRDKNQFETFVGREVVENIKDFDRVMDFYEYEMFDKDPIQTAIDNEDIERIILYSLIQIPKKTILDINEPQNKNPEERTVLFTVMHCHMLIILQVLESLEIFDKEELIIKSWIMNQITDPSDEGKVAVRNLINKARKDEKFLKEIWVTLFSIIELEFISSKGFTGDINLFIKTIDEFAFDILDNYFCEIPETAFKMIKPFADQLKEIT